MLLRPFLNGATSCASYLFGCGTHAELAVVDPHAEDAGPTGGGRRSDGLLFPYPGTDRLWTESEYRETGARTTSSQSREATVSAASPTTHMRCATSTRRSGSQRTTRRCTSRARWALGSWVACTAA